MVHNFILQGNRYKTSGKNGNQVCKKTGRVENNDTKVRDVKGAAYNNLVIAETIKQDVRLQELAPTKEEINDICSFLTNLDMQLAQKRTSDTIEQYCVLDEPTHTPQLPNTMQRQQG